jgi:hypothetical protein
MDAILKEFSFVFIMGFSFYVTRFYNRAYSALRMQYQDCIYVTPSPWTLDKFLLKTENDR